ncbi:acyltransferase-like protein At3g26840, chloroplastic isoform X2 [Juglans microcarpa x Juglans regia]|uniref:acyltransferase-like protein At3g26840, chloroplastic isoform X2 n=1 Tax=Juglans microcarpa x Juglans regia TaxID=2249226 RepID=UPI001B7F1C52|nr:acyltransferase-like protein At3g26840, chloroplastic isoform X2 [Juglans microcarpa x Juglans regia]
MAASEASLFLSNLSPALRRDSTSSSLGNLKSTRISTSSWRLAVSTEQTLFTSTRNDFSERRRLDMGKDELEAVASAAATSEDPAVERRSLKEYFERSKELIIRSNGGPPRWFTPLECGSPLANSPLLLFLPVMDRTPFTELAKLVERTIRSENHRSPNRPIYLVGESFGGCLALAVAACTPDIDLVLILANPASSFSRSQLQPLIPLLDIMPDQLNVSLPNMLRLMTGDPLRMVMDSLLEGFPLQQTVGELSQDLVSISSYLSVLSDVLPRETLRWKLQMLKSASAVSNSRLHAVKAQTLILSSGRDQLLPSQEEGERLCRALPKCEIRKFSDRGHFLFLEDGIDLVTIIKGAGFYRRGKYIDYVSDYMPPTPTEFGKIYDEIRWINAATSPVMLSTLEDGKIVRGLAGIPSAGPVLLVGYHMLLGLELVPLITNIYRERNILVRGIAHPMTFMKNKKGKLPDLSLYDTFRIMGAVPVSGTNFYKLLSSKSHVLLYPGGMREALHRKGEEYKLIWPEQSEFVRMAIRFGAKIIPFGAVGEDDIGKVVFDYDDLMKIPYFKGEIEELTNEAVKLRTDANGDVANQDIHLPGVLPKFPGRFYFYFGKPIETEGRKLELKDRDKSHELYLQVKSEVQKCIAYLKERRENDPYRNLIPRLIYHSIHGFTAEVPTFEL